MGSRTPDGESGALTTLLQELLRRIKELETPTGTSVRGLVDQVKAALANITTTVTAAIQTLSYTREQIDARIASTPGAVTVNGDHQVTGNEVVNGSATVAGGITAQQLVNFPAGVKSLNVRSNILSNNYAGQWVDGDGRMGISPSSRRFKKNIDTWVPNVALLMQLRPVLFRWNWETVATDRQVGFIAEELEALGPWTKQFLYYDADGLVLGINYDRLTPVVIALAQSHETRLVAAIAETADVKERLSKLENLPILKGLI